MTDPSTSFVSRARALIGGHRGVRFLLWALAALLGLWALGWLALPPLIQWQGEKIASQELGRAVRIGQVDVKPWSLELTLRDVEVAGAVPSGNTAGAAAPPPLLRIQRVYVDAAAQSLLRLAPVIDAIEVDAPALRMIHLGGGHYDFDDILARLAARPKPAETGEPARFALYNIALQGGHIDVDDRAVGRQHQVRDLRLALPFISNLPSQRQIKVQPQLAFVANGSAFDSRAQALPFADSRQTDAAFQLKKLDLAPYLGYIPAGLPLKLQAAVVDADLRLGFEQTPKPSLRVAGTLAVTGLKSVDSHGADALAFDALKLQLADVRPLERRVHLSSLELSGPQLAVRRDKEGQLNLMLAADTPEKGAKGVGGAGATGQSSQKSAAPPAPRASAAGGAAAEPAWVVAVDQLAVHGGTVDFIDDTTAVGDVPAALVRLNEVELAAKAVAFPLEQPLAFNGSAALVGTEGMTPLLPTVAHARAPRAAKGAKAPAVAASAPAAATSAPTLGALPSIEFHGTAGAQAAEVTARVAAVPLALAAPYLAPHLLPHLTGQLDAQLGLQWAPPKARDLPPELRIAAERLVLSQLMLADAPVRGPAATASAPPSAHRAAPAAAAPRAPAQAVKAKVAEKPTNARPGPLASVGQVELSDVRVDLRTRAASVALVAVQAPSVVVERSADGKWMVDSWLPPDAAADATPAKGTPPKPRAGPKTDFPWKWTVGELAVAGGAVGWRDALPGGPVELDLTQLQLDAKQIELNAHQANPIPVQLSSLVGVRGSEPGRIGWRGNVALTPLAAQGALDAQRLPVHALEPYFGDLLNIDVWRADTSFKGQVQFTQTAQGPRARLSGDASVEELRTHSRPGTAASADAAAAPTPAAAGASAVPRATGAVATAPLAGKSVDTASKAPLAPGLAAPVRGGNVARGLGEELLSWKALRLGGLHVQLEPGRPAQVDVKDTLLSDFYARLIIHPSGRINLQDVLKSKGGEPTTPAATAPVAAAPAFTQPAAGEFSGEASKSVATGAAATPAAAPKPEAIDPMAPIIRVGPVRLANGKVFFSDRFIRPNYSADLTELNGTLSAFSSVAPAGAPQMADLRLTGRAEGTAALDIAGKLNPLAKPLALDIKAKVTDLELPPLSTYSIKYAGHGIERGKLSMDVAYVVQPDGRLSATNKLVLNQLEFGEPVAGAPTSLPVKLATALLADSKGVIDLDLPISGSLNDPQFSVGPIIFKAIINLIGKAITAPFTLLARALGGGANEDMSNVPFAAGSAQLSPKAREQLDRIAKVLADRPQLKMTVVGTAQLATEREATRRERLKALVAAERRGAAALAATPGPQAAASGAQVAEVASISGVSPAAPASGAALPAAPAAALTDAEYATLLRQLYRRSDLPGKPRNAIGMAKDVPVAEMEAALLTQISVGEEAMRQLATQRGVAVKDYLASKNLPNERLFLGAARTGSAPPREAPAEGAAAAPAAAATTPASASSWSPRAELLLSAR